MKISNISFVRHALDGPIDLTAQLVECYRDVFAEEPWNEWLKCTVCGKCWGTRDREILASASYLHCRKPIEDFRPRHQVLSDLKHKLMLEASCWLAMDGNSVAGFCWGYPITAGDLKKKINLLFVLDPAERIAYQNEVGVLAPYRGLKIAKTLILRRLDDFLAQGLSFGVAQTRRYPQPSITYLWYTRKLKYQILAMYPVPDGRVVLGRSLKGLRKLLSV